MIGGIEQNYRGGVCATAHHRGFPGANAKQKIIESYAVASHVCALNARLPRVHWRGTSAAFSNLQEPESEPVGLQCQRRGTTFADN